MDKEHTVKIHQWLYPLSWIYGAAVRMRNKLFDWGVMRSQSFRVPVICVGNLAVGGTGKTPHTEYLIRLLHKEFQVAVLSRGYKRSTHGYVLATDESTAHSIGDEPYQMHVKYPSVTLAVDENRCHGITRLLALEHPSVDVVLLDDAFQHRYVTPGLSILLTDYHRLFSEDALLPAGRLREPAGGKRRAQVVIVTKCPADIRPAVCDSIAQRLRLHPRQQLFFSTLRYGNLRPVFADEKKKEMLLSDLHKASVLLLTGIASPASMLEKLQEHAGEVKLLSFGDHHNFTAGDMRLIKTRFGELNGNQRLIVTTEKDATRLIAHQELDTELKPFLYTLPIEIEILQNQQDNFNQHIIHYVKENTRNRSLSERKDAHQS